jgi:hypothetical protein
VCQLEQTVNVLVGGLAEGGIPSCPTALPPPGIALTWMPVWALAQASGDGAAAQDPTSDLASQLGHLAALLRRHAAPALDGDPEALTLDPWDPPHAASSLAVGRGSIGPPLIIGQGQHIRVRAYAQVHGARYMSPPPAPNEKALLETIASAFRGAIAADVEILDLGPDPYVQSDGGWIYKLQRALLQRAG